MWVDEEDPWIENAVWMKNNDKVKIENFIKYGCAGGLDLSTTTDLTSLAFMSNPDEEGVQDLIVFNFCPKDTIDSRSRTDRVPYRYWSEINMMDYIELPEGSDEKFKHLKNDCKILTATEGNAVDYKVLKEYIVKYFFLLLPKYILFDRHNSNHLVADCSNEGVEMLQFAQTIIYYSRPTKELERLVLLGKLRHGGNPILQWCLTGCKTKINFNEDIRLIKTKDTKRIDPLIASVMAEAGVLNTEEPETSESVYNNPDAEFYA